MSAADPAPPETLWRCRVCGQWSFSKRKPARHFEFVADPGDGTPPAGWVDYHEAEYDHEGGLLRRGGWTVSCGPFDQWEARKVVMMEQKP